MSKSIVFLITRSPFATDRPYHLTRMALALAVDARPTLLFSGDALLIDRVAPDKLTGLPDLVGQLRLFDEMVGSAYRTELIAPTADWGPPATPLDYLKSLSPSQARACLREANAVIRC